MTVVPPPVHRLPVEVFNRNLLFLDLESLICASYVCRQWRVIAFDHPNYWSHIVIHDVNFGTLTRSRHRMLQGGSRAIAHFEIDYRQKHDHDDPVLKSLIPLLSDAVPRARKITIIIESMYRLHVEDTLCQAAPHLQVLLLFYASGPQPDLHLRMPLGYQKQLLSGTTGKLRSVQLYNVILPSVEILAFENVDEVYFIHAHSTRQAKFPCYLFDFFPNMTRLRMTGGECWFENAPLPEVVYRRFGQLAWLDLEFKAVSLPAFFNHLPLHDLPDVTISSPDDDGIYLTLEPLLSYFDLILTHPRPTEFLITVKSRQTPRIRRFAEPLRYYYADSIYTNGLLINDGFMEQLASFHIHASLWARLKPWLPPWMSLLPKLILELNEDTPFTVAFPPQPLPCPELTTLVIQAKYDFSYVRAVDLIAFADRLTTDIKLELRRVLIDGPRDQLEARFTSVEYSLVRYSEK